MGRRAGARAECWPGKSGSVRVKRFVRHWREKITATFVRKTIIQVDPDSFLPGMDKILIHGGHPLSGSIKVSGSKNASLPILAATLLTREQCVVHGVPALSDTQYLLQILIPLGAQVQRGSGNVR